MISVMGNTFLCSFNRQLTFVTVEILLLERENKGSVIISCFQSCGGEEDPKQLA